MTQPTEQLLTLADVAGVLNVSVEQARKLCVLGKLRFINVGAGSRVEYRVQRAWLDEFMFDRDSQAKEEARSAARVTRKYAKAPFDVFSRLTAGGRGQ